jgi:hypothetical protein
MSADRELDHLENMSNMNGSRHWNQPYCYAEVESERDELSNEEMLARPKCELIGPSERVAQLVASAAASYYHTNLTAKVSERIGSGDPLDQLLADSFYRVKFNMKARQW